MFDWVLNRLLIPSSKLLNCRAYCLIVDSIFLDLMYYSCAFYIVKIRGGLTNIIL